MNKPFKEILNTLKELKKLEPQERLPSYFDMMWDIKYGYQLIEYLKMHDNPNVYSALARHGYDAKKIKREINY